MIPADAETDSGSSERLTGFQSSADGLIYVNVRRFTVSVSKFHLLFTAALWCGALAAGLTADIPYYDSDMPVTGDAAYLRERCRLDVYAPDTPGVYPVLVWFHGGGLSSGEKGVPGFIDPAGTVIVPVNYRLSGPRAGCPDYIYDAAAAVAWTMRHIAEYGGDPERICVAGHSAGGYLAAMITLDRKYLAAFGCSPDRIAASFPISGQMTTHFQVLAERRRKDSSVPDIALDEYAPVFHARKDIPPLFLLVGDTGVEWPSRVEENMLLEARLRRNFGVRNVRLLSYPGCDHGAVYSPALLFIRDYLRQMKK